MVVQDKTFKYEGYLDPREVEALIDNHLRDMGYVKNDLGRSESVHESGRDITVKKEPYKRLTEWAKDLMVVEITMTNLKETVLEREGIKKNMFQGQVEIKFDGFIEMDWENRWEAKAWYYFVATLIDQFVHKWKYHKYRGTIAADIEQVHSKLSQLFAMYKY